LITHSCLTSLQNTKPVVKSIVGSGVGTGICTNVGNNVGALISWATPGETTQAGIRQRTGGELLQLSAGSSPKLIEPFVKSRGFFGNGPGPFRGPPDPAGGSPGPRRGVLLGVILESVAKRSLSLEAELERVCPAGVITGSCANGHRFAMKVYCGREWCQVCSGKWEQGQAMKPGHARRFARWYPKAQQMAGVGYWTFTIPQELRAKYRTKKALGELAHDIQELLKSWGFSRGLRRWHYFGDRSQEWHPHLNCLVDGGFIDRRELRKLRREYSCLLGVKLAIAEYHYFDSPGEKVHALTYVTRATFLDWRWDPDMARELKGFRNQLWWGSKQWHREPVWSLDDLPGEPEAGTSDVDTKAVASLEMGVCPRCGLPITWERFLPISVLPELGGRELGAGYWELPYVRPPPYRLDLSWLERTEYWRGVLRKMGIKSTCQSGPGVSLGAWFMAKHKLFAQAKVSRLEQAEADRALWSEVLEPAKNFCLNNSPPGFPGTRDKTVRRPNC